MKRIIPLLALALSCLPLAAQVDYNGKHPWSQTTGVAPDSAVPGWFCNLGITGMREQLDPAAPRTLVVKPFFTCPRRHDLGKPFVRLILTPTPSGLKDPFDPPGKFMPVPRTPPADRRNTFRE